MKLLLSVLSALFLSAIPSLAEPAADGNALLLPTYVFEQNPPITAGFAFMFDEGGQRYAATAFHVFGAAGGMRSKLSSREVPMEVKALAGLCLGDSRTVIVAQPALYVEGARSLDAKGGESDVALFRVPDPRAKSALRLATAAAKVGDRVWLFTRLFDRAEAKLYPARITEVSATLVRYQFETASLNLRACSGAPILDDQGAVVGMHLGFAKQEDALLGLANPIGAVRERLRTALAGPAK
jgi:hypothetical protein